MRKFILTLFLFLCLLTTGFSSTEENPELEESCKISFISSDTFYSLAENKTLRNITYEIADKIIDSNYTEDRIYFVDNTGVIDGQFTKTEVVIMFTNEASENSNIFGVYYPESHLIKVYVKTIKEYYEGTIFDDEIKIKERIYNTLLHEIVHYFDIYYENNVFQNRSQIYGFEGNWQSTRNVGFYDWQKDIIYSWYNSTQELIQVPPHLQSSLNFTWVFENSSYGPDDQVDEMIARTIAICLYDIDIKNYALEYPFRYKYCDNFNFNSVDITYFNDFSRQIASQYFYQEYPELRTEAISSQGVCKSLQPTLTVFQMLNIFISSLVAFYSDNVIILIMFISLGVVIGGIIALIYKHLKSFLK